MNDTNYPKLTSLLPPQGIVFHTDRENPIVSVSRDLCKVTAFLHELQPYAKLGKIDDRWEHDALYFE